MLETTSIKEILEMQNKILRKERKRLEEEEDHLD